MFGVTKKTGMITALLLVGYFLCTFADSAETMAEGESPIPRLVMVGNDLSEKSEVVLSLSEASMSACGDVVLLDRAMITTLLQEHKLVAGGFANANDAIQLGRILSADIFIYVETLAGQDTMAVTAFETSQGVRLIDDVLVGHSIEAQTAALTAAINKALSKWRTPTDNAAAIALMSIRNVDLPARRKAVCQTLGTLLERQLLKSPSVVVVERKRLQQLNLESEISMGRTVARLLSAPVLLELDVGRGHDDDTLRVMAFLSDTQGRNLGTVRAEGGNVPALAHDLCAGLLEELAMAAASPMADPASESVRFFRMSRFWKAQERPDSALAAAEAAYALAPDNRMAEMLLINALFTSAKADLDACRSDSLAYAARAMAMWRQHAETPIGNELRNNLEYRKLASDDKAFFREYGRRVTSSRKEKPLSATEAGRYADLSRDWLAASPFASDSEMAASNWDLKVFTLHYLYYFRDAATAWRTLSRSLKRWINERMATDLAKRSPSLFRGLVAAGDPTLRAVPIDYHVRANLWAFLREQDDITLCLYGRCGRVVDQARQADILLDDGSDALLAEVYTALKNDNTAGKVGNRDLYNVALLTISRHGWYVTTLAEPGRKQIRQQLPEMIQLVKVMLAAGDVSDNVLKHVKQLLTAAGQSGLTRLYQHSLAEIESNISAAIANPATGFATEDIPRLQTFLEWLRGQLNQGNVASQDKPDAQVRLIKPQKFTGRFLGNVALFADSDTAYVLSAYNKPDKLLLLQFPLASRDPVVLGSAVLQGPKRDTRTSLIAGSAGVMDACIGTDAISVAVRDEGVFRFSRDAPVSTALHETTSLPITHPHSVGMLSDNLYIGTDDGYLVSYNTVTRTGSVLVATIRKERKSPFDNGPAADIEAIMPDPDRNRMVFVISVEGGEKQQGSAISDLSGIWEYRPEAGTFKQLFSFLHHSGNLRWCRMAGSDSFVMHFVGSNILTFKFNMATDTLDILSVGTNGKLGWALKRLLDQPGIVEAQSGALPIKERRFDLAPPFYVRDQWLWSAAPWGRLSLDRYTWEEQPPFYWPDSVPPSKGHAAYTERMNNNGPGKGINATIGMAPLGRRKLLLATLPKLWLVTLDE